MFLPDGSDSFLIGVRTLTVDGRAMSDLDTTVNQPGEEPPAGVSSEIMWRLAVRLWREHQPDRSAPEVAPGRPAAGAADRGRARACGWQSWG